MNKTLYPLLGSLILLASFNAAAENRADLRWRDWDDLMAEGQKTENKKHDTVRIVKALPAPAKPPQGDCISTDTARYQEDKAGHIILLPRAALSAIAQDKNESRVRQRRAEALLALAKEHGKPDRFGCLRVDGKRLSDAHYLVADFVLHGRAAVWRTDTKRFLTDLYAESREQGFNSGKLNGFATLTIREGRPRSIGSGREIMHLITRIS